MDRQNIDPVFFNQKRCLTWKAGKGTLHLINIGKPKYLWFDEELGNAAFGVETNIHRNQSPLELDDIFDFIRHHGLQRAIPSARSPNLASHFPRRNAIQY